MAEGGHTGRENSFRSYIAERLPALGRSFQRFCHWTKFYGFWRRLGFWYRDLVTRIRLISFLCVRRRLRAASGTRTGRAAAVNHHKRGPDDSHASGADVDKVAAHL